jgi:hypothetical protein
MLTMARSTASGLCTLVLDARTVHIDVLLLQRQLSEVDLDEYVAFLTTEWATLWGGTLTIGTTELDPNPTTNETTCIEALDALMSDAADAGTPVAAAAALAGFVYAGPVHDLVEYFVPKTRSAPIWHLPISQPITLWG